MQIVLYYDNKFLSPLHNAFGRAQFVPDWRHVKLNLREHGFAKDVPHLREAILRSQRAASDAALGNLSSRCSAYLSRRPDILGSRRCLRMYTTGTMRLISIAESLNSADRVIANYEDRPARSMQVVEFLLHFYQHSFERLRQSFESAITISSDRGGTHACSNPARYRTQSAGVLERLTKITDATPVRTRAVLGDHDDVDAIVDKIQIRSGGIRSPAAIIDWKRIQRTIRGVCDREQWQKIASMCSCGRMRSIGVTCEHFRYMENVSVPRPSSPIVSKTFHLKYGIPFVFKRNACGSLFH